MKNEKKYRALVVSAAGEYIYTHASKRGGWIIGGDTRRAWPSDSKIFIELHIGTEPAVYLLKGNRTVFVDMAGNFFDEK